MEVAAALVVAADARVNQVVLVVIQRRCKSNLRAFSVEMWPLAVYDRRQQGGAASLSYDGCGAVRSGLKPQECWMGCKEVYGMAVEVCHGLWLL